MKHIPSITLILLLLGFNVKSQSTFSPQNLGPNINSEYSEINPVLSIDGKTLYFSRVNHPANTVGRIKSQDIWFSNLNDDGTWSPAQRLPKEANIGRYNALLAALNDGKTFMINGIYNKKGTLWLERGFSLIERKDDGTWGKPIPLKIKGYSRKNRGKVANAYITPDKEYIFLAYTPANNSSKLRIYVSKKKKENFYSKPKELKGGINKGRSAEAPFLSADGKTLYFSGNFASGDNFDIYKCTRIDDSYIKWSEPKKLSDTINTPNWDSYYKLNAKGSWAYYASVNNSLGKSDIFRIKLYEENPFVKVTGLILNKKDETLMLSDTTYQILVNGQPYPGMKIDKASASYEALLPLGNSYTVTPTLRNWKGIPNNIDATNAKEFFESKSNLYLETIPFVLVKGKIINLRTGMPIPPEKNPRVLINGLQSDSIKYDLASSSYQVLLPLGAKYVLQAKVPNYRGKADTVNVLNQSVYQEKNVDLLVSTYPWIEVKGYALDNSTFTPILGNSTPKLMIDGAKVDSIKIDPATGEFTIRLPFGKAYKTSISAKDYNKIESTLDLTGYAEYTVVNHNVFGELSNANMALLNGQVINTKTNKPLEKGIPVKLKINGVVSPAFKYDSVKLEYSLKLPVGYVYDLTPSVYNFYNKYEPLDLSKVAPRTKIPKNFYVTPIEVGQSVDIENIYFETGKSELKPASFKSLNALVNFLNEYPNVKVEISGHTDNIGSASLNLTISEQRAKAVADYVISMGIPSSRIVSKGYGMTKPKYNNMTSQGRAKNRRVEFTITEI